MKSKFSNSGHEVAAYKHKDKRPNIPTEELREFGAGNGHAASRSPRDKGVCRARDAFRSCVVLTSPRRGASDNFLEYTGEKKKNKEAKVTTAQMLWVPAVNNRGTFGRWAFLE